MPVATQIAPEPVTFVTVPTVLAIQVRPEAQAAQAVKIWPSVPTARAVGVAEAVPVTIAPFPVIVEQGIAVDAVVGDTQVKPLVQAAQATRSWPSVPTARAEGVDEAVPVTMAPLPVMVAQGIAVPPELVVQQRPVGAEAQATRI